MMRYFGLAAAGALLGACAAHSVVKPDYYSAQTGPAKAPLKVALLTKALGGATKYTGYGSCGGSVLTVDLEPGVSNAVRAALSEAFAEVRPVETAAQAAGSDFLVEYFWGALAQDGSIRGGSAFSIMFVDPPTGGRIRSFEHGLVIKKDEYARGACFLPCMPGFYFLFPIYASLEVGHLQDQVELKTSEALRDFVGRIRRDADLLGFPKRMAQTREDEGAADEALGKGDAAGALLGYARALGRMNPGGINALRLEDKAAAAAARLGDARPPVPEQAKDLMARGKAQFGMARNPADFIPAAESMEKALVLAPSWPLGHFNTALAEEGAGDWERAARHMRIYLTLNPAAADREKVREKIAELQLHRERGDKPAGAPAPADAQ